MSAMNLMLPTTIQEQQLIGQFFKKSDRLITLHQQQKMFPKKGTVILDQTTVFPIYPDYSVREFF